MREAAREKQLSLALAYGTHINSSPAIEESNCLLPKVINKLSPVDHITIQRYVGDLKDKERQAKNLARLYRTQNAKLKQTCLDLHSNAFREGEGVRYFWRQQTLEGSSWSGRKVRAAVMETRK